MSQSKLCGMLGICKKAGRLITGSDLVLEAVRSKKSTPLLILLSADASANTVKKVRNCCTFYQRRVAVLPITGEQLAHTVGKTGVISSAAITEEGLINAVLKLLTANSENEEQREENV